MTRPESFWHLEFFEDRYEAWISSENPPASVAAEALDWIDALWDDAYGAPGARRETGLGPNVWFARMELTYFEGTIVVCVYQIVEVTRTVRCLLIATLSEPV